jgi:hypothetical protein
VHLLGNAPLCATTVLECSCSRIHRYVAAPIKYDIVGAYSLTAVALSMLQSNDRNRAPTEVVQISAYRDSSHRRNVASSRLFSIQYLFSQYSIRGILIYCNKYFY